ncbi:EF-hand domain-containing protein [Nesidiocoris tenuis]|uniref:EF-hand domain-containing protein n=1 Tax=Nesidiocoris tenuis TaxID=355587 RepID=A0ABN7A5C3_9HEMI|nr:EF-hand domain-containing protein [Nesidiocoris tenuis]
MEQFPLLPGYTFQDITRTNNGVPHKLEYRNGFPVVKTTPVGIGGDTLDVQGVKFVKNPPPGLYDPALTYGKCRGKYILPFRPHHVRFDKKCLSFKGYFTQEVPNSPEESDRIRKIEFIYFLEDDTVLVREPAIENAGFPQGRLVTRGKILKEDGAALHWKDLNNRIKIPINGTVYNLCACDRFTRDFLESQGIEVEEGEELPDDPYTSRRKMPNKPVQQNPPPDRYTKFLMYDKKVLRFTGIWDNRSSEYGDVEEYHVLYYPEDDTMEILKRTKRREQEPTAPLLARIKVPKNWKKLRATFPAESLENFYEHREETYLPQDLILGNTIDVFGRTITLIDCDNATRQFYENYLHVKQPPSISQRDQLKSDDAIRHAARPAPELAERLQEDVLPEWHKFTPPQPKTNLVRYLENMNKVLRYTAKFDALRPEDEGRKFIIEYRLSDGCIKIIERKLRNTGFQGGKFLGYQLVPKPNTCPANPEYYTPVDFEIGGLVNVFGHRFIITGADLAVYNYMEQNTEKFKADSIAKFREYFISEGRVKPLEKNADGKQENITKLEPIAADGVGAHGKEAKKCTFADEQML